MRAPALLATVLLASAFAGAQSSTPAARPPGKSSAKSPAAATAKAPSNPQFDKLVAQAAAARKAEKWKDAIALYAQAVKLRPKYVEGYWYQGTAYYTLEKFSECRDRFGEVVKLAPQNGAAYAFLGLCEYG